MPAGEPSDSIKALFGQAADVCPTPNLLRQLMEASATAGTGSATPPAPEPLQELAGTAYSFLSGSTLDYRATPSAPPLDAEAVRRDFPALHQRVNGQPLVWLDNAATTQKPQPVIDAVSRFYAEQNSNVHRGAHALAKRATDLYEGARGEVQRFLSASSPQEIVFVRGTTEGINLVAQTYGRACVHEGDEVVVSTMDHHSNIVPWQLLCEERGATLRVIPIDDQGDLILDAYARLLNDRTRIVAVPHVSNVLGTVVPLRPVIDMAHAVGAKVVVDGAQAVQHMPVNIQALDVDFYAFSGHKIFAPTGIGALYGKLDLLENMPPWQGGGSMIDTVMFEKTTFAAVPQKFEAGTGHIAGAVGLGSAIRYVNSIGLERVAAHEEQLLALGTRMLSGVPGLRLIGTSPGKVTTLTFVIGGVAAERIGDFLDHYGIAVRAGHHCAQPTMRRFGLTAAVRPSIALYNTLDDIERLVDAVYQGVRQGWS
jgi:cysteine desulfurase/selenocysteine lyase